MVTTHLNSLVAQVLCSVFSFQPPSLQNFISKIPKIGHQTANSWVLIDEIQRALHWGGIPKSVFSQDPADFLESYFHTYLKEEIREEGFVRQIEPFVRFREIAGNFNAQILNIENVA